MDGNIDDSGSVRQKTALNWYNNLLVPGRDSNPGLLDRSPFISPTICKREVNETF